MLRFCWSQQLEDLQQRLQRAADRERQLEEQRAERAAAERGEQPDRLTLCSIQGWADLDLHYIACCMACHDESQTSSSS